MYALGCTGGDVCGARRSLKRLAPWIGVLGVLFFCAPRGAAQISPGPLSKAHQSLEGTTQCATCHEFGTSTPTFKCLDCHKEIAQALAAKHGYHARLQMQNPNGRDCVHCHLEHNGQDFHLIHWEKPVKEFDHTLTGYPLEGKHAGLACEKCHTPANIAPAVRDVIKIKDLTRSFFGLSQNCATCHSDPHKGQLGKDCKSCHNTTDWKQAAKFDHSRTRYPLTGLHLNVACEKCHKPTVPGGPARYRGLKFGECIDCHVDPHKGSFKERCESCHTTSSWKKVQMAGQFDHSKTRYPLVGAHATVACAACHVGGDFKKPLRFDTCAGCHTPDPHKGQFADRPKKGECAECHTVDGWKPSLFGVKEHATSKYPLEGKHAEVACAKCHLPAGKDTVYKVKFAACADCHQDVHAGQFAAEPYRSRCEACHTVQDFHRTTFSIAKHRKTQFSLEGAHAAVPCNECHKVGAGGRGDKVVPYKFADDSCTACHLDPHHGEFNDRMAQKRTDGSPQGCEACHSLKSWSDVRGFDHSKTAFPLTGAHRAVACEACHKAAAGTTQIVFKGTAQECEACHVDVHGGQFTKNSRTPCASCHSTGRWKPSTFDHDKRTHFPLQGGHANVACAECHKAERMINGKAVLFYKPTPSKCADCHGAGT